MDGIRNVRRLEKEVGKGGNRKWEKDGYRKWEKDGKEKISKWEKLIFKLTVGNKLKSIFLYTNKLQNI